MEEEAGNILDFSSSEDGFFDDFQDDASEKSVAIDQNDGDVERVPKNEEEESGKGSDTTTAGDGGPNMTEESSSQNNGVSVLNLIGSAFVYCIFLFSYNYTPVLSCFLFLLLFAFESTDGVRGADNPSSGRAQISQREGTYYSYDYIHLIYRESYKL